MDETTFNLIFWPVTALQTVLVLMCLALFNRLSHREDKERDDIWKAIDVLRADHKTTESKRNADRRGKEIWGSINAIRNAVSELNALAAGQYVTREELSRRMAELKADFKTMLDQSFRNHRNK